ncbi:hypothetical protein EYZ11_001585 [Aspergillus tanneri]|nr:hypothetical protein EYZ11_001585 [Aspergillus tanneri]
MYECLPSKTPIRLKCRVPEVEDSNGVEVVVDDGTVERGNIVLGCDGVHSLVRSKMWESANKAILRRITVQEKKTFVTRYWFLFLTQPDKTFFFVFFRLRAEEEFQWPDRKRYTNADAEELAASVASHLVCETLIFREILRRRSRGSLISLEEGILSTIKLRVFASIDPSLD